MKNSTTNLNLPTNHRARLLSTLHAGYIYSVFIFLATSALLLALSGCGFDVIDSFGNKHDANKAKIIAGADWEDRIYVNNEMIAQGYYLGSLESKQSYYIYFLNWTETDCNNGGTSYLFDEEISTLTVDRNLQGNFSIEKKILGNPSDSMLNEFRDDASDLKSSLPMLFFCSK